MHWEVRAGRHQGAMTAFQEKPWQAQRGSGIREGEDVNWFKRYQSSKTGQMETVKRELAKDGRPQEPGQMKLLLERTANAGLQVEQLSLVCTRCPIASAYTVWLDPFSFAVLFWCDLCTIKFIRFKCTVGWVLVNLHSCATIIQLWKASTVPESSPTDHL